MPYSQEMENCANISRFVANVNIFQPQTQRKNVQSLENTNQKSLMFSCQVHIPYNRDI